MADHFGICGYEELAEEHHYDRLFKNKQWETKDKRVINISEMETSHIEKCIKMLEKKT